MTVIYLPWVPLIIMTICIMLPKVAKASAVHKTWWLSTVAFADGLAEKSPLYMPLKERVNSSELSTSIARVGLFHPVNSLVVTRN